MSFNLSYSNSNYNSFMQNKAKEVDQLLAKTGGLPVKMHYQIFSEAFSYQRTTLRQSGFDVSKGKLRALTAVLAAYGLGIEIGQQRDSLIIEFKSFALTRAELERIETNTGKVVPRLQRIRDYELQTNKSFDIYYDPSNYNLKSTKNNFKTNSSKSLNAFPSTKGVKALKLNNKRIGSSSNQRVLIKESDAKLITIDDEVLQKLDIGLVTAADLDGIINFDVALVIQPLIGFKNIFNSTIETVVAFKDDNFDYDSMNTYSSYRNDRINSNIKPLKISLKVPSKAIKDYNDESYDLHCYVKMTTLISPLIKAVYHEKTLQLFSVKLVVNGYKPSTSINNTVDSQKW